MPSSTCRSPHGERGLKYRGARREAALHRSLPSRGAGVEIAPSPGNPWTQCRRAPHRERGLKYTPACLPACFPACRSPHGERGLKFDRHSHAATTRKSLPLRGARVEISGTFPLLWRKPSLPLRGARAETHANDISQRLRGCRGPLPFGKARGRKALRAAGGAALRRQTRTYKKPRG